MSTMNHCNTEFVDQAEGLRKMGFTSVPDIQVIYGANINLRSYALQAYIDQLSPDNHLILDASTQGVVSTKLIKATPELASIIQTKQNIDDIAQRIQNNLFYLSATRTLAQVARGILSLNEVLNYLSEDKSKIKSIIILCDQRPFSEVVAWCNDKTRLTVCVDKNQDTLTDAYALIKSAQSLAPNLLVDFWSSKSDEQALQKFITISKRLLNDQCLADNVELNT